MRNISLTLFEFEPVVQEVMSLKDILSRALAAPLFSGE